jgi:hypothetical protein
MLFILKHRSLHLAMPNWKAVSSYFLLYGHVVPTVSIPEG